MGSPTKSRLGRASVQNGNVQHAVPVLRRVFENRDPRASSFDRCNCSCHYDTMGKDNVVTLLRSTFPALRRLFWIFVMTLILVLGQTKASASWSMQTWILAGKQIQYVENGDPDSSFWRLRNHSAFPLRCRQSHNVARA